MASSTSSSASSSPPDFDFSLPCRYFKSNFARSLSMHQGGGGVAGGGGANDMQCKSLDFDIGQYRKISAFNGGNSNYISNNNNSSNNNGNNSDNNANIDTKSLECPPLPERRRQVATATIAAAAAHKNEANNSSKSNNNNKNSVSVTYLKLNDVTAANGVDEMDEQPPAIPARCPIITKSKSAGALNIQQRQRKQQFLLAQYRLADDEDVEENENVTAATGTTHGNFNRPINLQQQQPQQHHSNSSANNNNSSNHNSIDGNEDATRVGCNASNRRNVWPTDRDAAQQQQQQLHQHQQQLQQQQLQQDHNLLYAQEHDLNANDAADDSNDNDIDDDDDNESEAYEDGNVTLAAPPPPVPAKRSTLKTLHYVATKPSSMLSRTAPSRLVHRLPALKAPSDNAANVQVILLQNQVDTLQWQLKQLETSNEMYRAVIEEIARFLDRYQTQKQQQRQLQQQQQISRSKSLYQVYDGDGEGEGHEQNASGTFGDKSTSVSSSCLRTRSSSNLIVDLKQAAAQSGNAKTGSNTGTPMKHSILAAVTADKRSYDAINTPTNGSSSSNNSYTTFKDFTWRRSPKKYAEAKAQAASNDVEEKLNQEAFRLSRTIQNLLTTSTRQPDLRLHRNASPVCSSNVVVKTPKTPTLPTIVPKFITSTRANANADNGNNSNVRTPTPTANTLASASPDMLFLRANNIRDSRLSLRSSTDSSVHSTASNSSVVSTSSSSAASTSSGKVETDDDVTLHHPFNHPIALTTPFKQHQHQHPHQLQHQHPLNSATEDESGFSSISSFHDIGVPLCSTMISNGSITPNRLSLASIKLDTASLGTVKGGATAGGSVDSAASAACDVEANEFGGDSRNSTLKANHPSNVLGVPLQPTHDMQHRWDAPAPTTTATTATTTKTSYRNANTKYQRFSTLSNEEAAAVLWV